MSRISGIESIHPLVAAFLYYAALSQERKPTTVEKPKQAPLIPLVAKVGEVSPTYDRKGRQYNGWTHPNLDYQA